MTVASQSVRIAPFDTSKRRRGKIGSVHVSGAFGFIYSGEERKYFFNVHDVATHLPILPGTQTRTLEGTLGKEAEFTPVPSQFKGQKPRAALVVVLG